MTKKWYYINLRSVTDEELEQFCIFAKLRTVKQFSDDRDYDKLSPEYCRHLARLYPYFILWNPDNTSDELYIDFCHRDTIYNPECIAKFENYYEPK